MTENYVSLIEWDTQRTQKTLRALMEKRFSILLGDEEDAEIDWNSVFNEDREMPGHQTKYDHMRDRTYLRPRDMIKFANCALSEFKKRKRTGHSDNDNKIDNVDVHNARIEYSEYFLSEIDDEIHKHLPDYEKYLDIFRAIGKWQFEKQEFLEKYDKHNPESHVKADQALEWLYEFSLLGFYRAGGRGFGGSEYFFNYRESRTRFDGTANRFRIHPGLIEVLGIKRA